MSEPCGHWTKFEALSALTVIGGQESERAELKADPSMGAERFAFCKIRNFLQR